MCGPAIATVQLGSIGTSCFMLFWLRPKTVQLYKNTATVPTLFIRCGYKQL